MSLRPLLQKLRPLTALLAVSVAPALFADLKFTPTGQLTGGTYNYANGLSADGSTLVGRGNSSAVGYEQGYVWTANGGMQGIGDLAGGPAGAGSAARAVSADGSVVVGYGTAAGRPIPTGGSTAQTQEAFRGTEAGGMVSLGILPGSYLGTDALAVSSDGSVVVGVGYNASSFPEAFRWTQGGGLQSLGFMAGGNQSTATGVSGDGSVVVGFGNTTGVFTGAYRWTQASGMTYLGDLEGGSVESAANAVSADGSTVVGYGKSAEGKVAFRWTQAGGMQSIGYLPSNFIQSEALAVSADGSVIVGTSATSTGPQAFVWDAVNGMRSLRTLLTQAGKASGWSITVANGVSADGTKVSGQGTNSFGQQEGWLLDLNAPPAPPATVALVWTESLVDSSFRTQPTLRLGYDNGVVAQDLAYQTGSGGGFNGVEYAHGRILVPNQGAGSGTRTHVSPYGPLLVTNINAYDLDATATHIIQANGTPQQIIRANPSLTATGSNGITDRTFGIAPTNSGQSLSVEHFTNAVQAVGDVFYFSTTTSSPNGLYKVNADGTGLAPVLTAADATAPAIYDFEVVGDYIYYGNITDNTIERVNTDGTGRVTLVTGASFPNGIDVTDEAIYWSEFTTGLIRRCDLSGGNVATLIEGRTGLRGVAVVPVSVFAGPLPQSIVVSGLTFSYTGAINTPVTLTGTATSGLPVSYEIVSGPATVSGNTVSFTGPGSVVLRASQAGDANYAPAAIVSTIRSAPRLAQTITFAALPDLVYSGSSLTFTPTATASSGLTVAFSITAGGAIATRDSASGLVTITGTGTVTLRATQAGTTTYAPATAVERTFTVSASGGPAPVAQTIRFESLDDLVYDAANPTVSLSATASSGLPVSFTVGSGPASIEGSTLTILGVGDITVIATQAGDAGHLPASPVERSFKVTEPSTGGGGGGGTGGGGSGGGEGGGETESPQAIDFPRPANRVYASAPLSFAPAATASSGLPVVFTVVSGPATYDPETGLVTVTGAGFVTLLASQPGDASFENAESVSRTFAVTSSTPQASDIIGAWKLLGEENDDVLIVFNGDGTYYLAELGEADDFGESGLEYGTYAWNPVTGVFTATPSLDQNGDWGLSNPTGAISLLLAGDQLFFEEAGEDEGGGHLLARISATPDSALVGAWKVKTETGEAIVIFLPDGTYFQVERGADDDSGHEGMEHGTYTWDPVTGTLVTTPGFDDNGDWGLSDPEGEIKITVTGNTLSVTDGSGSGKATRVDKPSGSSLKSQSIKFDPPSKLAFTTSPVALVATASSKLPVTFEVLEGPATLGEDGTSLLLAGVGRVKVRATQPGDATFSAASRTRDIDVAKGAQTITFTGVPAKLPLSTTPVVLAATASSGLPVEFTVTGPATLGEDGVTLTFDGPGAVKITANQFGDDFFAPAKAVDRVIKVENPALVLGNLTQTYTGFPLTVTVSGAPEGLADRVYVTYTGPGRGKSPEAPVFPGKYDVAVSFGAEGAVVKTGKLEIKKAVLTVGVENATRFVGQANPAFTLTYSGFVGPDTEDETAAIAAIATPPTASTKAGLNSPAGGYDILLAGGKDETYELRLLKPAGQLSVLGFGGDYEALLLDNDTGLPVGKLSLVVAKNGLGYTGRLALAREVESVIVASVPPPASGSLATIGGTVLSPSEDASHADATWSRSTEGVDALSLYFTVSADGTLAGSLDRNGEAFAQLSGGRIIHVPAAKQTVPWGGQYSLRLLSGSPVLEGDSLDFPTLNGQASASIAANTGVLTLSGRLADGSLVTASLKPWRIPAETEGDLPAAGYALWTTPYGKRAESFLAGPLDLAPDQEARRYAIAEGALTWTKAAQPELPAKADANYRDGFGPLSVPVTLDPWLAPSTKAPIATLAQRLGLADTATSSGMFEIAHGPESLDFGNDVEGLPLAASLSAKGVVSAAANTTAWKITKIDAAKGVFSGSFTLHYTVSAATSTNPEATKNVTKTVTFTGQLRQPVDAEDDLIGTGGFLLRSPNSESTEELPGEILLRRAPLP